MNKRLSKMDYLLTLLILAILIGALASFFFGVKVGKDKTAEKYERLLIEKQQISHELTSYHQQYLVSFYHTIYLPYREFQKSWFKHLEDLELRSGSVDPQSVLREVEKLANEKFKEIEPSTMPDSSPLLKESQNHYLKSLKLFADAAKSFRSKASSLQGSGLIKAIESDAFFTEAQSFGLLAQHQYYESIVAWNASVDNSLDDTAYTRQDQFDFTAWSKMNFNLKNAYVTRVMEAKSYYKLYYPQDLTIRIDEMILDGQAEYMGLTTIEPIIELLVHTDAVRTGDYIKKSAKFYKSENLPQLPFFFE